MFVRFDQNGGGDYVQPSCKSSSRVGAQRAAQAITLAIYALADATFGTSFTVAASSSGGPVSFSGSGSCTSVGAVFTMTSGSGSCFL